jgi:hypothetical protein
MQKIGISLSLITVIILIMFSASCTKEPAPLQDYLIQVDSIQVADTVSAGVSFDIVFFGTIGFDMCHSFKVFNLGYNGDEITIQAWGTFDSNAEACPEALVSLDGRKLAMTLNIPGYYTIFIKEPAGYSIYKEIFVQ